MIRQVQLKDKYAIRGLINEFYEESLKQYGLSFDLVTIDTTIENFINNHICLLIEKDNKVVGVIAGMIAISIFDASQKIAQEAIWYITKEERKGTAGIRLFKAFEDECKARGANIISMIRVDNISNRLDKLYKSRNYQLAEFHYLKEV